MRISDWSSDLCSSDLFVAQSGGYHLLYINASDDTIGEAINDAGQVSGLFSTPGPASTTHGFIPTPAALPVGTTASGAYVFSVDVVAHTPTFIDPEVALGYHYRTGHGDPKDRKDVGEGKRGTVRVGVGG